MSVKKLNTLTLQSKIDLIKCREEQQASVKFLVEKFKCSKTQVYEILKHKQQIKGIWQQGLFSGKSKRKPRKTGNEEINKILHQWFLDARTRNLPISGPILQEQAKLIAERLGNADFKASNGWLSSFKSRYEITLKQICGEYKDVKLNTVNDWQLLLKELIQNYSPENIGNCNETGLLFKALPSKTLTLKNEECSGEKQPKERLTVLLCGFADGTLEKPLVIGKSLRPRCFKNLNLDDLPVIWRSNNNAWMTAALMEEWLKGLNRKMIAQKRKILLFLDNAACRPRIKLSNIELAFFPSNTTSLTQPMDQGIIQNMKLHYRKLVLQSLCANISTCTSVTELFKKISVLDAIRWISSATKKIKKDCVKKCFQHAGFRFGEETEVENERNEALNEIEELIEELGSEDSTTAESYIKIDKEVVTKGGYQTLDDLIEASHRQNEDNNDEEEGQGLGAVKKYRVWMEAVNGVSEVDKGGPTAPSPLTGCYLLIVVGEPHSKEHKDIILRRIAKGLLSWDAINCHVDLEKELAIITEQAPEGEDARFGERLIQFASENLVTEILIHPSTSTLSQCMKNLLSSFTRHRHIVHAGYTFAASGSWILQDGTYSLIDFSESFQEIEVQRILRAYDNTITLDIHCSPEGDWTRLPKESFTKNCKVRVNPDDVLTSGSPSIVNFLNYVSPFLIPMNVETLLESSDVVGNIRFSHPTLYVFPGGQGDAALFGINGFNMLVDGGFARKSCFWDFARHLDRLDAIMLTRLNNSNVNGINSLLKRKRLNIVYPQIGHVFCNIQERKAILSPDGDKDKDPLMINLLEEGNDIVYNLRQLHLQPQTCYRDLEPINLYHKVGHGTLDMYILNPAKESKEVRDFVQKWNNSDQRLFGSQRNGKDFHFPLHNLVSICALLVWQPANINDSITRILFPGSTPQHKIFEGLDRLKQLECIKYSSCSIKTLTPSLVKLKQPKIERIFQDQKEKTKDKVLQQADAKTKSENKVDEENIKNIQTNGIVSDSVVREKIIKKHDSTESDKSGPPSIDIKKSEDVKESIILTNGKSVEEKLTDKVKLKSKPDQKAKIETKAIKQTRSIERKPKTPSEKKASPTTPKKSLDAKVNGDVIPKPRTISKISPSATPAKSTKDANNRKVVESKYKAPIRKEALKSDKKDSKPERKPITRRPKDISPFHKAPESPVRRLNELQKVEARKSKLEKEGTTDSSTVSTPTTDAEGALKKDLSKLTPEEIEQLKARELAELKEEQEVVKEIEAVFRKSEKKTDVDSDLRKVKSVSVDEKTEGEEYLIVEKEVIEHDSLDDHDIKESETQKHLRDSEESEKQRKLSIEQEQEAKHDKSEEKPRIEVPIEDLEEKQPHKEPSKEVSATSTEDKVDVSSSKKIAGADDEDNKEVNVLLESQPDEKFSTPIESGATTAPTLPEDERIPLDEIKEGEGNQVIEEKHVKEDTKEKEIPVLQIPPKTTEPAKIPSIVGIRLDKQTPTRDLVKTPDEVADLPMHEEVDIENYEHYQGIQGHPSKLEDSVRSTKTVEHLESKLGVTYPEKQIDIDTKVEIIDQTKLTITDTKHIEDKQGTSEKIKVTDEEIKETSQRIIDDIEQKVEEFDIIGADEETKDAVVTDDKVTPKAIDISKDITKPMTENEDKNVEEKNTQIIEIEISPDFKQLTEAIGVGEEIIAKQTDIDTTKIDVQVGKDIQQLTEANAVEEQTKPKPTEIDTTKIDADRHTQELIEEKDIEAVTADMKELTSEAVNIALEQMEEIVDNYVDTKKITMKSADEDKLSTEKIIETDKVQSDNKTDLKEITKIDELPKKDLKTIKIEEKDEALSTHNIHEGLENMKKALKPDIINGLDKVKDEEIQEIKITAEYAEEIKVEKLLSDVEDKAQEELAEKEEQPKKHIAENKMKDETDVKSEAEIIMQEMKEYENIDTKAISAKEVKVVDKQPIHVEELEEELKTTELDSKETIGQLEFKEADLKIADTKKIDKQNENTMVIETEKLKEVAIQEEKETTVALSGEDKKKEILGMPEKKDTITLSTDNQDQIKASMEQLQIKDENVLKDNDNKAKDIKKEVAEDVKHLPQIQDAEKSTLIKKFEAELNSERESILKEEINKDIKDIIETTISKEVKELDNELIEDISKITVSKVEEGIKVDTEVKEDTANIAVGKELQEETVDNKMKEDIAKITVGKEEEEEEVIDTKIKDVAETTLSKMQGKEEIDTETKKDIAETIVSNMQEEEEVDTEMKKDIAETIVSKMQEVEEAYTEKENIAKPAASKIHVDEKADKMKDDIANVTESKEEDEICNKMEEGMAKLSLSKVQGEEEVDTKIKEDIPKTITEGKEQKEEADSIMTKDIAEITESKMQKEEEVDTKINEDIAKTTPEGKVQEEEVDNKMTENIAIITESKVPEDEKVDNKMKEDIAEITESKVQKEEEVDTKIKEDIAKTITEGKVPKEEADNKMTEDIAMITESKVPEDEKVDNKMKEDIAEITESKVQKEEEVDTKFKEDIAKTTIEGKVQEEEVDNKMTEDIAMITESKVPEDEKVNNKMKIDIAEITESKVQKEEEVDTKFKEDIAKTTIEGIVQEEEVDNKMTEDIAMITESKVPEDEKVDNKMKEDIAEITESKVQKEEEVDTKFKEDIAKTTIEGKVQDEEVDNKITEDIAMITESKVPEDEKVDNKMKEDIAEITESKVQREEEVDTKFKEDIAKTTIEGKVQDEEVDNKMTEDIAMITESKVQKKEEVDTKIKEDIAKTTTESKVQEEEAVNKMTEDIAMITKRKVPEDEKVDIEEIAEITESKVQKEEEVDTKIKEDIAKSTTEGKVQEEEVDNKMTEDIAMITESKVQKEEEVDTKIKEDIAKTTTEGKVQEEEADNKMVEDIAKTTVSKVGEKEEIDIKVNDDIAKTTVSEMKQKDVDNKTKEDNAKITESEVQEKEMKDNIKQEDIEKAVVNELQKEKRIDKETDHEHKEDVKEEIVQIKAIQSLSQEKETVILGKKDDGGIVSNADKPSVQPDVTKMQDEVILKQEIIDKVEHKEEIEIAKESFNGSKEKETAVIETIENVDVKKEIPNKQLEDIEIKQEAIHETKVEIKESVTRNGKELDTELKEDEIKPIEILDTIKINVRTGESPLPKTLTETEKHEEYEKEKQLILKDQKDEKEIVSHNGKVDNVIEDADDVSKQGTFETNAKLQENIEKPEIEEKDIDTKELEEYEVSKEIKTQVIEKDTTNAIQTDKEMVLEDKQKDFQKVDLAVTENDKLPTISEKNSKSTKADENELKLSENLNKDTSINPDTELPAKLDKILIKLEHADKEDLSGQVGLEQTADLIQNKTAMDTFRKDSMEINRIDKKLQALKEAVDVTSDTKQEESIKLEQQSKAEIDIVTKIELGRKSPKEREQDVAKIVASVAEVLKSDAPLEEFEGKIPLAIKTYNEGTPYTTELRETHITTIGSPVKEDFKEIKEQDTVRQPSSLLMFLEEERKTAFMQAIDDNLEKCESKVSSLLKDSTELMQATSKIISDIKQSTKTDTSIDEIHEQKKAESTAELSDKDDLNLKIDIPEKTDIIPGPSILQETITTQVSKISKVIENSDLEKPSVEDKDKPHYVGTSLIAEDDRDSKVEIVLDKSDTEENQLVIEKFSKVEKCMVKTEQEKTVDVTETEMNNVEKVTFEKSEKDIVKELLSEKLEKETIEELSSEKASEIVSDNKLSDSKKNDLDDDKSRTASLDIKDIDVGKSDIKDPKLSSDDTLESLAETQKDIDLKTITHSTTTVASDQVDTQLKKVISLETTPITSGKTTPEIKEPFTEEIFDKSGIVTPELETKLPSVSGRDAPENATKEDLITNTISITSGKSTPEIVQLMKATLDVTKSPILSGRSTPDIVIEEDNGLIISRHSTPDAEVGEATVVETRISQKDESVILSESVCIKTEHLESGKSTPENKDDIEHTASDKVVKDQEEEPSDKHVKKEECIPAEQLSLSKSSLEEATDICKLPAAVSEIVQKTEVEESKVGIHTPPTVPVSPILKEKLPELYKDKGDETDISQMHTKFVEVRSTTPISDDCDISSGQVSRVITNEEEDEKQLYSDDDIPGSPLSITSQVPHSASSQCEFEESLHGVPVMDPMCTSFYGALPDESAKSQSEEVIQKIGASSSYSPSHTYEITVARYSSVALQEKADQSEHVDDSVAPKIDVMTSSFIGTELPSDPIVNWGKPLGLPSPAPMNDNKGTPKKERRILPSVVVKNKLNEDKKLSEGKFDKKGKKINPVYVDLTYVPHHGNSNYAYVDFFKRVRARYYVFSGVEPSRDVFNALLEAKQTWENKDLEVTIIPTYDTDVLGYWVAENEDLLSKYKIDLSPSASRCTINLQDHETSCSAYRLEFS